MGNRSGLYTPSTKKSAFYSDLTDNLIVNPMTEQLALVTNEEDVKSSLRRLVLMGQHDREYEDVGGNVRKLLFEPIDSLTRLALQNALTEVINNWEPRAQLISLVVNAYPDRDEYVIDIIFSIINNPSPVSFSTILYKIR